MIKEWVRGGVFRVKVLILMEDNDILILFEISVHK